jgi:hypothetical protein
VTSNLSKNRPATRGQTPYRANPLLGTRSHRSPRAWFRRDSLPRGDRPDWSPGFLTETIHRETGDFFYDPHFINGKTAFRGQIIAA